MQKKFSSNNQSRKNVSSLGIIGNIILSCTNIRENSNFYSRNKRSAIMEAKADYRTSLHVGVIYLQAWLKKMSAPTNDKYWSTIYKVNDFIKEP